MKLKTIIPAPEAIGREAIIVVGGAILGAVIISMLPGVGAWIRAQWNGDTSKGCSCGG